jgi:hypothetical protein
MSGSSENRCIRLEGVPYITFMFCLLIPTNPHALSTVIRGKNLQVPSQRVPAGIYVSINVDSQRLWKSTTGVLSSENSVAWGDAVTLQSPRSLLGAIRGVIFYRSSHTLPALSVEIRASYEAGRILGSGEVIGKRKLHMSWDELLNHGDEPFGE